MTTLKNLLVLVAFFEVFQCNIVRLPTSIKPVRYTLTVEVSLDETVGAVPYSGSVIIDLQVLENTNTIKLNKRKLTIDEHSIKIRNFKRRDFKVSHVDYDKTAEIYAIVLEEQMKKGDQYKLSIQRFNNTLNNRMVGFYTADYHDVNNIKRPLAVTDFEPSDARLAFPCFDEPSMKSKFNIQIIRNEGQMSVSNAPLEYTEDLRDGRYKDIFKETPDMPTYLVAWVVSDYKRTKTVGRNTIIGRPIDVDNNRFDYALNFSAKALRALEEYTDVEFVFNKMEQVAVPDVYFRDEAMENWGLIIYKETDLLCSDKSSAVNYKIVATYIAHEFAHQWFGNLVTPSWWDYTWLSESFAAYFQFYIANTIEPTWRLGDQFVVDNLHRGFATDEYRHSIPLNHKITRLGEFPPLHILYFKGSVIIRMVEHFLTEPIFKKGLQIFLRERKYKNAEPKHLYEALQEAVDEAGVSYLLNGQTVNQIMSVWDSLERFPIVTATRCSSTGNVTFEQDIYWFKGKLPLLSEWRIPITYAFESSGKEEFSNTTTNFWLTQKAKTISTDFPLNDWFIVNKQQIGYYRVNYDKENWERIIAFMNTSNFNKIHVLNRAQLIDDAFNLAKSRLISYEIPIRLCRYLFQETDFIPLTAFYNNIDYMYTAELKKDSEKFKEYMFAALDGVLKTLGYEVKPSDTLIDRLNRMSMVTWLCKLNHETCVNYARNKLEELKKFRKSTIHPDLEKPIYCKGMENATEEEFNILLEVYKNANDLHQKPRLKGGLTCNRHLAFKNGI
ncbi:hypothetical protein FQA39_LY17737 [Lamprigera yunnana]|nr:hypothetical protein FQA39_LY17737 [Lamprigera yunnana]